ncbi:preprotein translocase subunit YajC [Rheinheimera tilapiae]|jgi:preprotein translocase subunit YajC|uniref:Sec translocon accessory complex subunit YajC n=1 Tax=Rheinheimera tilapiae TaxID=875043 RepID=A0ABV6B9G0_9GAMM
MSFFISDAQAQTAAAGQPGGGLDLVIMLAAFGLIFYFMIFRPQSKRMKEHKNLMSSLAKGDEVLTQGGLVGRIAKIADDKDFVVIALNDTTEVTVQKGSISAVLPKGTMKSL